MKLFYVFVFAFSVVGFSQQLELVSPLQDTLQESSGLIYLNQKLITHNDSGGEPILYEIDSVTGGINRSVVLINATNIDWEAICFDATYIYIADFGNNNGSRTNLRVYRVSRSDYFNTPNDTITCDTIQFSYSDQTDFTSTTFATNFDAEAMISVNDSLYIFTKNWGNNWSNIYPLSKLPGTYQIDKLDSLNSQGLITGGTYSPLSNSITLTGYTTSNSFILDIGNFTFGNFVNATINRFSLIMPVGYSFQVESISPLSMDEYYLTSESSFSGNSGLFRFNLNTYLSTNAFENEPTILFPNPASDLIHIKTKDFAFVKIYDSKGVFIKSATEKELSISELPKGIYIFVVSNSKGSIISQQKIVIE